MDWNSDIMRETRFFHHPDYCPLVMGRRATECFVMMLYWYGEILMTAGRALYNGSCFPTPTAYYSACYRLKKNGVLACNSPDARWPVLKLDDNWKSSNHTLLNPNSYWKKRWSGVWSVLVYDVPEVNRIFRDNLRRVLKRYRMGYIQKSVWASPWDMRPMYDDLINAVGIDFVSYLFEAKTVLGRNAMDIVETAWDFEQLNKVQKWYMRTCQMNIERLRKGGLSKSRIVAMASEEITAYETALIEDPLLPQELHPADYEGTEVFVWHKQFVRQAHQGLKTVLKS